MLTPPIQLIGKIVPLNEQGPLGPYIKELQSFVQRNAIEVETQRNGKITKTNKFCINCFKAHALTTAREMNLYNITEYIYVNLKGRCGHEGYYLDNSEVKKILI